MQKHSIVVQKLLTCLCFPREHGKFPWLLREIWVVAMHPFTKQWSLPRSGCNRYFALLLILLFQLPQTLLLLVLPEKFFPDCSTQASQDKLFLAPDVQRPLGSSPPPSVWIQSSSDLLSFQLILLITWQKNGCVMAASIFVVCDGRLQLIQRLE